MKHFASVLLTSVYFYQNFNSNTKETTKILHLNKLVVRKMCLSMIITIILQQALLLFLFCLFQCAQSLRIESRVQQDIFPINLSSLNGSSIIPVFQSNCFLDETCLCYETSADKSGLQSTHSAVWHLQN